MIRYAIEYFPTKDSIKREEVSKEVFKSIENKYGNCQFRLDEYADHCVLTLFDFNGYFKGVS